MKILSIFGTRPEAIKMFPICQLIEKKYPQIDHVICLTAQHKRMLDDLLGILNIRSDYYLDIMEENQSLSRLTSKLTEALDNVIKKEASDWVLVQGDTTTAMIGALTAFYNKVKIGHIEAGLRSMDIHSPFPEEANRKFIDNIADLHFAPTPLNKETLLKENIDASKIHVVGNTVIDALRFLKEASQNKNDVLFTEKLDLSKKIILVTAHRREHFGLQFEEMCNALAQIASKYNKTIQIVFPVHLNPNVQIPVKKILSQIENIFLIEPVDYLTLLKLMSLSYLILTDSGGIQEEAPTFGKPVLVMRDVTERMEAVYANVARLIGKSKSAILENVGELIENNNAYESMVAKSNPFGDGHSAERIIEIILNKNSAENNLNFSLHSIGYTDTNS